MYVIKNVQPPKQGVTNMFRTNLLAILPKINIAPARRPSQKERIVLQPSIFRCELFASGRVSASSPVMFSYFFVEPSGISKNPTWDRRVRVLVLWPMGFLLIAKMVEMNLLKLPRMEHNIMIDSHTHIIFDRPDIPPNMPPWKFKVYSICWGRFVFRILCFLIWVIGLSEKYTSSCNAGKTPPMTFDLPKRKKFHCTTTGGNSLFFLWVFLWPLFTAWTPAVFYCLTNLCSLHPHSSPPELPM